MDRYETSRWRIVLQCVLFVTVVRPEELFNTTPPPLRTNFSCRDRRTGFYADVEADCKVYHTCDDYGNKFSYRCPEETAFRQDALICDHARLVNCRGTGTGTGTAYADNRASKTNREESSQRPATRLPYSSLKVSPLAASDSPIPGSYSRTFKLLEKPVEFVPDKRQQPGFASGARPSLNDRDERNSQASKVPGCGDASSSVANASPRACDAAADGSVAKTDVFATPTVFINRFDPNADVVPSRAISFGTDRRFTKQDQQRFPARDEKKLVERQQQADSPGRAADGKSYTRAIDAVRNGSSASSPTSSPSTTRHQTSSTIGIPKPSVRSYDRDYPYSETLRSIQANSGRITSGGSVAGIATTTEIPAHALTMSLQPLVPNELEHDPYYPRTPTSTEAYYTPSHRSIVDQRPRSPVRATWSDVSFQIPAVLPDFNNLEDLLDRRKLFYIPRMKSY